MCCLFKTAFAGAFEGGTFRTHWFQAQTPNVAALEGRAVGMYKMGPNFPDLRRWDWLMFM
ncbi:hypothetical protein LBG_09785 [Stenotrophomonas maltophilia]|nr:hypothetical protein [Stenotrophomonas maltophilia]QBL44852.1 hypothetical protein LBG_09785 [Stenotrophomonas maltophilia]